MICYLGNIGGDMAVRVSSLVAHQPEFGQRLRQLRRQRGMSQRQIAGELVTASYVSLLESGGRVPTLDVVFHLARQLGTTTEAVLGVDVNGETPPRRTDPSGMVGAVAAAPSGPEHADVDLTYLIANESIEAGDLPTARAMLEQAVDNALAGGEVDTAVHLGLRLQSVLAALGADEARLSLISRLMAIPAVSRSLTAQVALQTDQASTLRALGRLADARSSALIALGMAQDPAVRGTPAHVRCLGVLISTLCELDDLTQVQPLVQEMIDLAARGGWPAIRGRAHWVAAIAYSRLGLSDDAREQIRLATTHLVSPELPLADWARFCRSVAGILIERPEDIEQARGWLNDGERAANVIGVASEIAAVTAVRARMELALGNPAAAAEFYVEVTGPSSPLTGLDLIRARIGYADALAATDRVDTAIEWLRRALELCESTGAMHVAVQVWRRLDALRGPA
jgi:transcriptional regulator with XRE-family HTH domain